jgi:hypothetical protein
MEMVRDGRRGSVGRLELAALKHRDRQLVDVVRKEAFLRGLMQLHVFRYGRRELQTSMTGERGCRGPSHKWQHTCGSLHNHVQSC